MARQLCHYTRAEASKGYNDAKLKDKLFNDHLIFLISLCIILFAHVGVLTQY
jgi:hypothetical protein